MHHILQRILFQSEGWKTLVYSVCCVVSVLPWDSRFLRNPFAYFAYLQCCILQGYDSLLSIDDVEKKALAQPPENRSAIRITVTEASIILSFIFVNYCQRQLDFVNKSTLCGFSFFLNFVSNIKK